MPDDDDLRLVHRLRALTVELDTFGAEFAARHRLHATDVRALIVLLDLERADEVATPGRLARELGLNAASVTAVVDRLGASGLVDRRRDQQDRRRVQLQVTARARDLGGRFFGPLIGRAVVVIEALPPDHRRVVGDFLDAMIAAVGDARDTAGDGDDDTEDGDGAPV